MATKKTPARHKALNPNERENQMINLAMDVAEEQMLNGTASAGVITHFLKLGTENAKLERELLKNKSKQIESATNSDENAKKAIEAFKGYSPKGNRTDEELE